jgi:4-hydroxy-2-oxoheptanedioate aldolase
MPLFREVPADRATFGIWQSIPTPMVSRFLALMGWDWVVLDIQHGCLDLETVYECVHALRQGGVRPLVRVGIGDCAGVQKALDLGAGGIVVPMVNSPAEAQLMANAAKYPPLGGRSFGGDLVYHFGMNFVERANSETLLLVQIEHIDAVRNVDAILSTPGVDGAFLGPADLALSMGIPWNDYRNNANHRAALEKTLAAGRALGKIAAINSFSLEDSQALLQQGFKHITFLADVDLFMSAGKALHAQLRQLDYTVASASRSSAK